MKKVLVTGCAGFIGSVVTKQLLEQGYFVVGVDNLNDYYSVALKKHRNEQLCKSEKFEFHHLDIENKSDVANLFKQHQFETVFNLAARAGVRYSMENPDVYFSTNLNGTLNILDQIKDGKTKFVLASTSSLYAGQKMPFSEELAVNTPISPYAASKKAAEVLSYSYHYLYGIDISIVRYFTVYGPAGRPDMSIFRFIKWIDDAHVLEVFGDGGQSRDFTYVEDIARGTILAAKKVGYEVFNLGGGKNPISLNTVISMIETKLNKKAKIKNESFHKADILETWADISKAEKILNWRPQVGLDEGISKSVAWYLENKAWAGQIKL